MVAEGVAAVEKAGPFAAIARGVVSAVILGLDIEYAYGQYGGYG
jgi:hypothetical protein